MAKERLSQQKKKTGVAILGKPSPALESDPKFQGTFKNDSIKSGEMLALASLSSELLVLNVTDVHSFERKQYIGRSQYPAFVKRPLVCSSYKTTTYATAVLVVWSRMLSMLRALRASMFDSTQADTFDNLVQIIHHNYLQ